jgi:stearoyl-CoA desaturase (delta-9 desaturase)
MRTKEWVAVHRKHHQCSDIEGDPHSPQVWGIYRVLFGGALLYAKHIKENPDEIEALGLGTPEDWIERNIYTPLNWWGIVIMLAINIALFGYAGIIVWGVQMLWIPFWAAGVINGLAHWVGYRNYDTRDTSRNLLPIAIWIGGEELHNNHHGNGTSAKLSKHWWEFDIGWMYIQILRLFRLASVRSSR